MVLEIAKAAARTELPGRGLSPDARAVCHVAIVVPRRVSELADAPVDRRGVVEAPELPRDPEAGGEPAPQRLLRHLPIAARPEWPRALKRPVREVGRDADPKRHLFGHQVAKVAEQQRLLRRRQRPACDVVAEPGVREPPGHPDHGPVPVEIVPGLDGALPAQVVRVRLIAWHLVQVSEQAVEADVQRPLGGSDDVESGARRELAGVEVGVTIHRDSPGRVGDGRRPRVVLRAGEQRDAHQRGEEGRAASTCNAGTAGSPFHECSHHVLRRGRKSRHAPATRDEWLERGGRGWVTSSSFSNSLRAAWARPASSRTDCRPACSRPRRSPSAP